MYFISFDNETVFDVASFLTIAPASVTAVNNTSDSEAVGNIVSGASYAAPHFSRSKKVISVPALKYPNLIYGTLPSLLVLSLTNAPPSNCDGSDAPESTLI